MHSEKEKTTTKCFYNKEGYLFVGMSMVLALSGELWCLEGVEGGGQGRRSVIYKTFHNLSLQRAFAVRMRQDNFLIGQFSRRLVPYFWQRYYIRIYKVNLTTISCCSLCSVSVNCC